MKELPPGYRFEDEAIFCEREDCMGHLEQYWTITVWTPNNKCLIANGGSAIEATEKVIEQAIADAEFKALPDKERLEQLLVKVKQRDRFYDGDLIDVINILLKRIELLENK